MDKDELLVIVSAAIETVLTAIVGILVILTLDEGSNNGDVRGKV